GHDDAAVGLLILLEDRDHRPAHREPRTVEGMEQLGLLALGGAMADLRAPRLEVAAVRAAGNLAILLLTGKPDLEVVGLARGEAEIARAENDPPIVEPEALEHRFRVSGENLELVVRTLRDAEAHELHLVELV